MEPPQIIGTINYERMRIMPNIGIVLKNEIARLARKEIKKEADGLKKASAQFRRDVAELKRQIAELTKKCSCRESASPASSPMPEDNAEADVRLRFTAKGLKSQRKRLGLSAGEYGKLVGVSAQSVYLWERGAAHPRAKQIAQMAALRNLGKKEALAQLQSK